jgi:hypothetical protein
MSTKFFFINYRTTAIVPHFFFGGGGYRTCSLGNYRILDQWPKLLDGQIADFKKTIGCPALRVALTGTGFLDPSCRLSTPARQSLSSVSAHDVWMTYCFSAWRATPRARCRPSRPVSRPSPGNDPPSGPSNRPALTVRQLLEFMPLFYLLLFNALFLVCF